MQMFQARKILERLQDNSDIVSLINAKGGILSILDDEAWFTCLDCRDAYWTWTIDWNDHCDKKVSWRRLWSPRPRTRLLYQKSSKAMGTMPGQAANLPRFFLSWRLFFWEMFSWQDYQEQDGRLGISVLEQPKRQLAWVEMAEVRWSLELSSLASRPDAWWAHLNTLMRWPIPWH